MAESLHQGMAQWVQCKLGKQYLWKKITLPWESNPGPTPNRGDLATLVYYFYSCYLLEHQCYLTLSGINRHPNQPLLSGNYSNRQKHVKDSRYKDIFVHHTNYYQCHQIAQKIWIFQSVCCTSEKMVLQNMVVIKFDAFFQKCFTLE